MGTRTKIQYWQKGKSTGNRIKDAGNTIPLFYESLIIIYGCRKDPHNQTSLFKEILK